jgi:hypothetical protein
MSGLIKVIMPLLFIWVFACAPLTEKRTVNGCRILDNPVEGRLRVSCPDLELTLFYDNTPDGRDPAIFKVEGTEAQRLKEEKIDPYRVRTGDHEILVGWAYREEWKAGNYLLRAFEYFVNGGTACYEEEEGVKIELVKGEKSLRLLNLYQEETDCGGA